jgi:hypothetical protein
VHFGFGLRLRLLAIAVFTSVAMAGIAVPARADDTSAARPATAKRSTTSFESALPAGASGTASRAVPFSNGFLYVPGAQPGGVNVGGRVPVGKSHVYVPYYGNVSNDPTHPGVQGTAGIAYGFRTWDISVFNGGLGTPQTTLPGVDAPKTNPALSVSIRF